MGDAGNTGKGGAGKELSLERKMAMMKGLAVLGILGLGLVSLLGIDYGYDELGRLVSAAYATGVVVTYTWDDAGNLSGVSYLLGDLESDSDHDGMPDGYEETNGLNPFFADDGLADRDGDGLSNGAEFYLGTNPQDAQSKFSIDELTMPEAGGQLTLKWPSVAGRTYILEKSSDLATWEVVASGVSATPPQNSVQVTATGERMFVRVRLQMP